jgi:hypothetical protein
MLGYVAEVPPHAPGCRCDVTQGSVVHLATPKMTSALENTMKYAAYQRSIDQSRRG